MCSVCGCNDVSPGDHAHGEHTHSHQHSSHRHSTPSDHNDGHVHMHHHDHYGAGEAGLSVPGFSQERLIEIERNILSRNDVDAAANRRQLSQLGAVALNLMSSPGAGKTTLLVETVRALRGELSVAVVEGDQETSHRRGTDPGLRGAGSADQHRTRLPPGCAHGRPRAGRVAAGGRGCGLHRERGQPGMSRRLRSRRDRQSGHSLGH